MARWKEFAILGLVIGLAGCASISVNTTVATDGTISEYQMQANMSTEAYGLLDGQAKDEGYDGFEDLVRSELNTSAVKNLTYNVNIDGDDVSMLIRLEGINATKTNSFNVTRANDNLTFRDTVWYNSSRDISDDNMFLSRITLTYHLTMPGEIVASNADEVDGNTATWRATGQEALYRTEIRATSRAEQNAFGPGFGLLPTIVALTILGMGGWVWRRRE